MQCKWSLIVIYLCLVIYFLFWQHSPQRASISKTQQFYSVLWDESWIFLSVLILYTNIILLYPELYYIGQGDIVVLSVHLIVYEWPLPLSGQVRIGEWAVPSIKNLFFVNYVCWVVHYRYLICVQFFHPLFTIFPFVCALFNNIGNNLYSGPENQENSWSISTGCCLWFIQFLTCFNFAS